MNYWLDLFTGTTWQEFRKAGGDHQRLFAPGPNVAGHFCFGPDTLKAYGNWGCPVKEGDYHIRLPGFRS